MHMKVLIWGPTAAAAYSEQHHFCSICDVDIWTYVHTVLVGAGISVNHVHRLAEYRAGLDDHPFSECSKDSKTEKKYGCRVFKQSLGGRETSGALLSVRSRSTLCSSCLRGLDTAWLGLSHSFGSNLC